jgi:ABC-type amino acid transport substrate-binding protein
MRRRRLRRVRNRRAVLVIAVCAIASAPLAAQAAQSPTPPGAAPAGPPASLVVALGLRDPSLDAGVVRGGEVVLARGFEVELARLLARRLGARVERFVELRPTVRLVAGGAPSWQLALGGLEPSPRVRAAGALSDPYLTTDMAVVLRRHLPRPRSIADLRGHVLCAVRRSNEARTIATVVRPKAPPLLATGLDRLREQLRTGACDVALVPAVDTGRFLRGHRSELGPAVGRIPNGRGVVIAVARGGGLGVTAVNAALQRMRNDGTLGRLARAWLGLDPASLRVLR